MFEITDTSAPATYQFYLGAKNAFSTAVSDLITLTIQNGHVADCTGATLSVFGTYGEVLLSIAAGTHNEVLKTKTFRMFIDSKGGQCPVTSFKLFADPLPNPLVELSHS